MYRIFIHINLKPESRCKQSSCMKSLYGLLFLYCVLPQSLFLYPVMWNVKYWATNKPFWKELFTSFNPVVVHLNIYVKSHMPTLLITEQVTIYLWSLTETRFLFCFVCFLCYGFFFVLKLQFVVFTSRWRQSTVRQQRMFRRSASVSLFEVLMHFPSFFFLFLWLNSSHSYAIRKD